MRAGGLNRGGRRTLVIPADLAYGRQGTSFGVPGNAVLVYTLILVGLNESFDLTEVTPFWVTPKGIHILASSSPWRDGAQRAFVARSDLAYGMLRMFQTLLYPEAQEVAVFRTASQAWQWLEQVPPGADSSLA